MCRGLKTQLSSIDHGFRLQVTPEPLGLAVKLMLTTEIL